MPTSPAEIYDKSGEKVLILNTRTQLVYPFDALGWVDLRVGFFLSLTKTAADDDPATLAETISVGTGLGAADRSWIGLKNNDDQLPKVGNTVFIGFSTSSGQPTLPERTGDTKLGSSDLAVGTTNAYFWRPNNSDSAFTGGITDGFQFRAHLIGGTEQHFAQDPANSGGYAVLHALRLTRPSGTSNRITVSCKTGTHSGDMLFSNTPTLAVLQANLEAFPGTVQTMGPITLSSVPDALFAYWPFRNSRLRIHSLGFVRAA